VIVLWFLRRTGRRAVLLVAVFLGAYAAPVGGWIVANQVQTGAAIFLTVEGRNMLMNRAAGAVAYDEGIGFREAQRKVEQEFEDNVSPARNESVESVRQRSYGIKLLLRHPLGTVRSTAYGIVAGGIGPGTSEFKLQFDLPRRSAFWSLVWAIPVMVDTIALYLAAAIGARSLWRRFGPAIPVIAIVVIAYAIFVAADPESNSRFRLPVVPTICLLAGEGVVSLMRGRDPSSVQPSY
jgi:hypothetical protein